LFFGVIAVEWHTIKGYREDGFMPKQKTHKGISKRFRLTASGQAKFRHSGTSHLAYRLTKKRRRNLRGTGVVASTETAKIVTALTPAQ
jgi:large subunit ribosomal protein L35